MSMFLPFALLGFQDVFAHQARYEIIQVNRQAVFAGRLGDRVREALVVERNGTRYTIHVKGDYHTRNVRLSQRFQEGETIRLPQILRGAEATVDRSLISVIKP